MIELEKTYLAKKIPEGLDKCKHKEIIDIYVPKQKDHPTIRIRKNGDKYEITKKEPVKDGDSSKQEEQTIKLRENEFNEFRKMPGKKTHKIRYYYPYKNLIAEIDVFKGPLNGLIVVDFEFDSENEKDKFEMPEFCLADVTQEVFLAGGMVCGKNYEDIKEKLESLGYKKLFLENDN
jgi:CYTH domain-containing protein